MQKEEQERPATDVQAQFSGRLWIFTRIAFGQSAASAQKTHPKTNSLKAE